MKTIALTFLYLISALNAFSQNLTNTELQDSIASILRESKTPAAFVRVVTKDSVLFQSEFGSIDADQKIKLMEDDLFALGSISKTLTALGIMKLVSEGKLNLEDELKVVAPEVPFTNNWEEHHPVKIKDLLSHRSGFDDMHISDIIKKRSSNMSALEEVMTYRKSYHSNWKPGLVFSYSNPGYVILGFVIEKVSGKTYQQYISENILTPLHMDNTFYLSTNKSPTLIQGFQQSENGITPSDTPNLIGESAGGLISNGDDMTKLLQFFLAKGELDSVQILSPHLIEKMEQLQSDFEISNNIETGYSLGMYDRYISNKNLRFKAHNGSIIGFTSDYIFSRSQNLGIAISTSLFQKSTYKIMNLLVNEFANTSPIEKSEITKINEDISTYTKWEGTYKMLNGTNDLVNFINVPFRTMKLSINKDKLHLKRFMQDVETYEIKYLNAFSDDDGDVSLYLSTNDQEKVLVYYEDTFVKINPYVRSIMLFLLIFGIISGVVVTLIAFSKLLILPFKKSGVNTLKPSILIALPFLLIVSSVAVYLSSSSFFELNELGTISITSVSIFILSALYPVFNIYSGYILFKRQRLFKNSKLRIIYNSLFVGVTFFSLYCLYFGWFALSLWNY